MFDELLAGWARSFDEIGLLEEYKKNASVVKYANESCFKLKDFTPEDGRIVRDVSNNRASGIGEYGFKGYYRYDAYGKLVEITDVSNDGQERLRYCYWDESEGLQGLAGRLAGEMAGWKDETCGAFST
jgi:hypothetical protein